MTTSYTDYQGRGFWANDTVIELWLHLLTHTNPTKSHPAWIARARDDWAIQASVGFLGCVNVVRHRLNRGGDRTLNAAIHTIAKSRQRCHQPTNDYISRRTTEGRTPPEITRNLKRYIARQIWRIIQATP